MALTLEEAVGQRIRQLRERAGVLQEDVAKTARVYGVPWTQATVAAIELGQRNISLGEFLLLPLVLGSVLQTDSTKGHIVQTLASFVPDGTAAVEIAGVDWPLSIVRELLGGDFEVATDQAKGQANPGQAGPSEAERKAAHKLGITPEKLDQLARNKWGRSLVEERAGRWNDCPATGHAEPTPARLGAITRKMIRELRPLLLANRPRRKSR